MTFSCYSNTYLHTDKHLKNYFPHTYVLYLSNEKKNLEEEKKNCFVLWKYGGKTCIKKNIVGYILTAWIHFFDNIVE